MAKFKFTIMDSFVTLATPIQKLSREDHATPGPEQPPNCLCLIRLTSFVFVTSRIHYKQNIIDKIYQPLIEIYQQLIFFINGMLFDNNLLSVQFL